MCMIVIEGRTSSLSFAGRKKQSGLMYPNEMFMEACLENIRDYKGQPYIYLLACKCVWSRATNLWNHRSCQYCVEKLSRLPPLEMSAHNVILGYSTGVTIVIQSVGLIHKLPVHINTVAKRY